MAEQHLIYHWKHGWIPLTHAAALSKAKGNAKLADHYVPGASSHHSDMHTAGSSARAIHATLTPHERHHSDAAEVAKLRNGDHSTVHGMDEHGQPMSFTGRVSGVPTAVRIKQGRNGKVEHHLAVSMHNGSDNSGGDASARTTVYVKNPGQVSSSPRASATEPQKSSDWRYEHIPSPTGEVHWVNAYHPHTGERVGDMTWHAKGDHHVTFVSVYDEKNRRKGVATGMWNHAQSVDPQVSHNNTPGGQTDAGRAWAASTSAAAPTSRPTEAQKLIASSIRAKPADLTHVGNNDYRHEKTGKVYRLRGSRNRVTAVEQVNHPETRTPKRAEDVSAESSARLQIRESTYRGEAGHAITGTDTHGRRTDVFVPGDRLDAQKVRENIKAGRPTFDGLRVEKKPSEQSTSTGSTPDASKRVQVDHSGDGTTLEIDRTDTQAREAVKAAGFRWSSNLGAWYLPRTYSESTRRQRVEEVKRSLGEHNVHVADGGRGATTTAAEREAATRAAAADRAERMDARAQRAATEADVRFGRAHAIGDMIPMGQPILVGHHSEGRHRRDLAKIDSNMRKGVEAQRESEAAAHAAENARRTAAGDSPLMRQRRIDRNEAEVRKIDRQLQEHRIATKAPQQAARVGIHPLSSDYHDQLTAQRAQLTDQIAHDKAQIEASGHKEVGLQAVKMGDFIVDSHGRAHVVSKVNQKTVSVPSSLVAGWEDKVAGNQITKHVPMSELSDAALKSAAGLAKGHPKLLAHYMRELNRRGIHLGNAS